MAGNHIRSIMGNIVDFDALKLKKQLVQTPIPTGIKQRETLAETRANKRAARRLAQQAKRKENETLKAEVSEAPVANVVVEQEAAHDDNAPQRKQQMKKVKQDVNTDADGE